MARKRKRNRDWDGRRAVPIHQDPALLKAQARVDAMKVTTEEPAVRQARLERYYDTEVMEREMLRLMEMLDLSARPITLLAYDEIDFTATPQPKQAKEEEMTTLATQANQYISTCHVCKQTVQPYEGVLDGKNPTTMKSLVRHRNCVPTERTAREELEQEFRDAVTLDPFGKRAVPVKPADVPALKDYLAEGERVLGDLEDSMADMVGNIAEAVAAEWDVRVPALVAKEMEQHKKVEITIGDMPPVVVDKSHKMLPTILTAVVAGTSPFIVGPAGSGKTTLAEQIATTLGRKFYMAARVTSEFKLVGFKTATGEVVRTQFREAYEHGGVFLFDEIDASDPDALTAFNAALANGYGDFPDGMVKRHPDFVAIAAGNTFGRGADRQYVGRNQLDAATLDRFVVFYVDYDEQLEKALAGNDSWCSWVQRVRKAVDAEKVRAVVSPRASIGGAKLLAAGMARSEVEEATVWKGMDAAQRLRVTEAMRRL